MIVEVCQYGKQHERLKVKLFFKYRNVFIYFKFDQTNKEITSHKMYHAWVDVDAVLVFVIINKSRDPSVQTIISRDDIVNQEISLTICLSPKLITLKRKTIYKNHILTEIIKKNNTDNNTKIRVGKLSIKIESESGFQVRGFNIQRKLSRRGFNTCYNHIKNNFNHI